jgi:hypothetical protein
VQIVIKENFTVWSLIFYRLWIRDSLVSITMGYGLDGWGSIPGRAKRFFSTPQHPDQLWGPPSLLLNGYWELISQD